MSRHNRKNNCWKHFSTASFLILGLLLPTHITSGKVTNINAYGVSSTSAHHGSHNTPEIEKTSHRISASRDEKSLSRSDKVGNVIFSDNFDFSGGSSVRSKDKNLLNSDIAGGLLQNHRLEEGPLSPEIASSAAAAAIATTSHHGFRSENDLKIASDNVHVTAAQASSNNFRGAGATFAGGGQSRSLLPGEGQLGWASNPGSCLFSCSSASLGYGGTPPVSCCQLNYVQCCPNPIHEQWNFKNLHHGRGNFLGGGAAGALGALGKGGGYGWGSIPYNPPHPPPPPIVKKSCGGGVPYHQHYLHTPPIIIPPVAVGGSIIHKGIETIKLGVHNIGQYFKSHGWGAGGNGAAGYYFHRRSDNDNSKVGQYASGETYLPKKKKRAARSVNHANGWGTDVFDKTEAIPCPVYSAAPPIYPPRPYIAGLGSLIGWTKPGNQIHHGGFSTGYEYGKSSGFTFPPVYSSGKTLGWGNAFGSNFCKSDFECQGFKKCCKGFCQDAAHIHNYKL